MIDDALKHRYFDSAGHFKHFKFTLNERAFSIIPVLLLCVSCLERVLDIFQIEAIYIYFISNKLLYFKTQSFTLVRSSVEIKSKSI